jgi:hypothetical protein
MAYTVGIVLLGAICVALNNYRNRSELFAINESVAGRAFLFGAGIYCGTFLLGTNFVYRLMFLLLCVPQLQDWQINANKNRGAELGLFCLLFGVLWLNGNADGHSLFLLLPQLLDWLLFGYLVVVLMGNFLRTATSTPTPLARLSQSLLRGEFKLSFRLLRSAPLSPPATRPSQASCLVLSAAVVPTENTDYFFGRGHRSAFLPSLYRPSTDQPIERDGRSIWQFATGSFRHVTSRFGTGRSFVGPALINFRTAIPRPTIIEQSPCRRWRAQRVRFGCRAFPDYIVSSCSDVCAYCLESPLKAKGHRTDGVILFATSYLRLGCMGGAFFGLPSLGLLRFSFLRPTEQPQRR